MANVNERRYDMRNILHGYLSAAIALSEDVVDFEEDQPPEMTPEDIKDPAFVEESAKDCREFVSLVEAWVKEDPDPERHWLNKWSDEDLGRIFRHARGGNDVPLRFKTRPGWVELSDIATSFPFAGWWK